MRLIKTQIPVLLLASVRMLLPGFVVACDCGYAGAPCKAFEKTPTVFVGLVTTISRMDVKTTSGDDYYDRLVSFAVERSYKGLTAKTADVLSVWNSDCGYRFQEGVRYLVYAYPRSSTGKLTTGICSRTRPLSEASEDLEYLNKKEKPSHGAGIEGMIEELDSKSQTLCSLEGIQVLVQGPAGNETIVTRKDGRFQLWGAVARHISRNSCPSEIVLARLPNCEPEAQLMYRAWLLGNAPGAQRRFWSSHRKQMASSFSGSLSKGGGRPDSLRTPEGRGLFHRRSYNKCDE